MNRLFNTLRLLFSIFLLPLEVLYILITHTFIDETFDNYTEVKSDGKEVEVKTENNKNELNEDHLIAVDALRSLGFNAKIAKEKVINIVTVNPDYGVEDIVKLALKK